MIIIYDLNLIRVAFPPKPCQFLSNPPPTKQKSIRGVDYNKIKLFRKARFQKEYRKER
jgi:hypothetical protein